ncbi:MAG: hypothetical protein WAK48_04470 [Candidatus Acidiferrum sp.]
MRVKQPVRLVSKPPDQPPQAETAMPLQNCKELAIDFSLAM